MCPSLRGCRCRTTASRSYTRWAIFGNTISDQHQDDGGDDDDKEVDDAAAVDQPFIPIA